MSDHVLILGVKVHKLYKEDVLNRISETLQSDARLVISYVHVKALNQAYENPALRDYFNRADLVYCDGFGVKWAARLLGADLPARFTLADWLDELIQLMMRENASVFFLGGPPEVAQRAADKLGRQYPELKIAGANHGYFDKTPGSSQNGEVISKINAANPDLLLVGMGTPIQEYWLDENLPEIKAKVIMSVGGLLEYYSGDLKRGPQWMTQTGFEWLYLLLKEPARYWKRYLFGNPLFILRVLKQKITG